MAHDALPGSVSSSSGSSLWMGMTSDCIRAPERLPRHRTAMIAEGEKTRRVGVVALMMVLRDVGARSRRTLDM